MREFNEYFVKCLNDLFESLKLRKAGWNKWKRRLVNNEDYMMKFLAINILFYILAFTLFRGYAILGYLLFITFYIYSQIKVDKKCTYDLNPAELKVTSVHEAGHAIIGLVLGIKIELVTTKPERNSFGRVKYRKDQLDFKSELENELTVLLGGMVAEEMAFDEHTYCCNTDVREAIDLAKNYLSKFAMGERFVYNESELNSETNKLLQECKKRAEKILQDNKKAWISLIGELEAKREMEGEALGEFFK